MQACASHALPMRLEQRHSDPVQPWKLSDLTVPPSSARQVKAFSRVVLTIRKAIRPVGFNAPAKGNGAGSNFPASGWSASLRVKGP